MSSCQAAIQAIILHVQSPLPEVCFSIDALPFILINYPQVPYHNIRPRYDGANYGGPTLLHNDTGHVDAVTPLPKISKEDLVNWQHAIGALSDKGFTTSTPMVEEASTTLINLLMQLVDNTLHPCVYPPLGELFTLPHAFHVDSTWTPGTLRGVYMESTYTQRNFFITESRVDLGGLHVDSMLSTWILPGVT